MTIAKEFNKTASYYDDWVRKAIPCYDEVFKVALELIPDGSGESMTVLDLGAGTGLFSQHVVAQFPKAHFILWDVAEDLLEEARTRFADKGTQFEYVINDYRDLHQANVDIVISSLSIHHLSDPEKQKLFEKIYSSLRSNGIFVNIDQIAGETEKLADFYWSTWLEKIRASGVTEEQIQESMNRRKQYDHESKMFDQLHWLKRAGFQDVDCVYKYYFIGVFFGRKG
jgi:tRNA (cmo5U34)-methyltransferase